MTLMATSETSRIAAGRHVWKVSRFPSTYEKKNKKTSKDVVMCQICTGYMKRHSTTSSLRATPANILRRRAAASRSELRKMSDCTCVTHIASQLSAVW